MAKDTVKVYLDGGIRRTERLEPFFVKSRGQPTHSFGLWSDDEYSNEPSYAAYSELAVLAGAGVFVRADRDRPAGLGSGRPPRARG